MSKAILTSDFSLYRYGLFVRLVKEEDAAFIVKIRTQNRHSRFISKTSEDESRQVEWIRQYKEREKRGEDYYFVFEYPKGNPVGVSRIYNICGSDFTTGSWVFASDAPLGASLLGAIISKEIAYEELGLEHDFGQMFKENKSVVKLNFSYKPRIIKETEDEFYVLFDKAMFYKIKENYVKLCVRQLNDSTA